MVDRDRIEKEAKEIIDKFAKALEKVEKEDKKSFIEREDFERSEENGKECNFKKNLLENAPKKNHDFVIVERGEWK